MYHVYWNCETDFIQSDCVAAWKLVKSDFTELADTSSEIITDSDYITDSDLASEYAGNVYKFQL